MWQAAEPQSIEPEFARAGDDPVALAIGRRGTLRKLEVEGEELPKVVYRLIDPEQYRRQHALVVGGGDSALEAATSIADQPRNGGDTVAPQRVVLPREI